MHWVPVGVWICFSHFARSPLEKMICLTWQNHSREGWEHIKCQKWICSFRSIFYSGRIRKSLPKMSSGVLYFTFTGSHPPQNKPPYRFWKQSPPSKTWSESSKKHWFLQGLSQTLLRRSQVTKFSMRKGRRTDRPFGHRTFSSLAKDKGWWRPLTLQPRKAGCLQTRLFCRKKLLTRRATITSCHGLMDEFHEFTYRDL